MSRPQTLVHVVDSHTAGNPTRIVVGGVRPPRGIATVPAVQDWLREEADWIRRRLNHEPRGGALTCAVLPLPPTDDTHDLGAVILEPGSYPPMCGHCMIGLATVAHELGLAEGTPTDGGGTLYRILTPAGRIAATYHEGRPSRVDLENVESYVVDRWTESLGGREVVCTLLYGGDYYPTVDADDLGLELDRRHADDIVRIARELSAKVAQREIIDPHTGRSADVYQVMFHQRSDDEPNASTIAVVAPPGAIDRSPCGTGSSALMALKVSTGELGDGEELTTRSVIGSEFRVRAKTVRTLGGRAVVVPVVTGSAHVNGFATIVADPPDRLRDGFPPL